jgi:HEPN domain-containing protein
MNDGIVKLWIVKADNDLKTGKDELATEKPATDMVCFHMQQCVEKCLKSFLVYNNKEISKTHNLTLLLQECIGIDQTFEKLRTLDADELSVYAVGSRYPDDFYMPTRPECQKAVNIAEDVREFVLARIKLT